MSELFDVIIVGGGPCGLACAIEIQRKGLSHLIIEKASITESIRRYPKGMTFFSTAENLEIGGIPFPITGAKPTRNEALQYYRKVTNYFNLNLKLFAKVISIENDKELFTVTTSEGAIYESKNVVISTGYFDFPRMLDVPGIESPQLSYYYDEPYHHAFTNVVIIGGGNSAIEAALDLYRHNVDVTIVHRREDLKPTAKYWLIPDIRNRIKEGKIKVQFNSELAEIRGKEIIIKNLKTGKKKAIKADFVYLLIGYLPDIQLLVDSGVKINKKTFKADYDKTTYETSVKGLYLCGTVLAGIQTESVFIENGREHAAKIAEAIVKNH